MVRGKRGFTLIEIIVVIACIALLAAIIAPLAFSAIEDAKISRANADVKSLGAAIGQFNKDTGLWPNANNSGSSNQIATLVSTADGLIGGAETGGTGGLASPIEPIDYHLMINESDRYDIYDPDTKIGWNGAYLNDIQLDPWGNSYIVTVDGWSPTAGKDVVWVVSCGPNGTLDTNIVGVGSGGDAVLQNDDIGIRLK